MHDTVVNVGGIRHGISPGPIDDDVIRKVLPWDGAINEGLLTGIDIKDMLEHSIGSQFGAGGFLAVRVPPLPPHAPQHACGVVTFRHVLICLQGISFLWDPRRPDGDKIVSISVANYGTTDCPTRQVQCEGQCCEALDLQGTYTIAATKFILGGGDGYDMLKDVRNVSVLGSGQELFKSFVKPLSHGLAPFSPAFLAGSVRRVVGSVTATVSDTSSCCEHQCSLGTWAADTMLKVLPANLVPDETISLLPCKQIRNDVPSGDITD